MATNPYLIGLGEMNLAELPALIQMAHADASELTELEWKLHWDFSPSNPKRAGLAKHIVAMANRDPDRAAQMFAGHAYIVIGVEPGEVRGVDPLDPADVDQMLRPYTGSEIGWHSANVEFGGKNVLVVVVDPPRWGDPVHALRKGSEDPETGEVFEKQTVYVRRPGTSTPADAEELARLEKRAATKRPRVHVSAKWNDGRSGQFIAISAHNEPHGLPAPIEQIGFAFTGDVGLSTTKELDDDPDAMSGLGSFPFDVGNYILEPGETHDFRIGLAALPELIDLDTELFPYCYHSGGTWAIGGSFRFRDVTVDGWQPPVTGPSIFPTLRVDVMRPDSKRGIWSTFALAGWEDVHPLPSFYPIEDKGKIAAGLKSARMWLGRKIAGVG